MKVSQGYSSPRRGLLGGGKGKVDLYALVRRHIDCDFQGKSVSVIQEEGICTTDKLALACLLQNLCQRFLASIKGHSKPACNRRSLSYCHNNEKTRFRLRSTFLNANCRVKKAVIRVIKLERGVPEKINDKQLVQIWGLHLICNILLSQKVNPEGTR